MRSAVAPVRAFEAAVLQAEVPDVFSRIPEPSEQCIVVMRTRVSHAVLVEVVRHERTVIARIEREFHYAHTGNTDLVHELLEVGRDLA